MQWQIVTGTIKEIGKGGRFIQDDKGKLLKSRITADYTKLSVQNKDAKADQIAAGMTCKVWFEGDDTDAGQMECAP